jgi:hypothetical protein
MIEFLLSLFFLHLRESLQVQLHAGYRILNIKVAQHFRVQNTKPTNLHLFPVSLWAPGAVNMIAILGEPPDFHSHR